MMIFLEELKNVDLSNMTPIDALNKLYELQNKIKIPLVKEQFFRWKERECLKMPEIMLLNQETIDKSQRAKW